MDTEYWSKFLEQLFRPNMTSILLKRGSKTAISQYTGSVGEMTFDVDNKALYIHDGSTRGGIRIACLNEIPTKVSQLLNDSKFVTSSQGLSIVTKTNNGNTWIRKYSDGFIIQGGANGGSSGTVTLNTAFSNTNYSVMGTRSSTGGNEVSLVFVNNTTTSFRFWNVWAGGDTAYSSFKWIAFGY